MKNVIQIIKTFTSTKQHNSILNGRVKFKVFINLHVPVHVDYVKLLNIIGSTHIKIESTIFCRCHNELIFDIYLHSLIVVSSELRILRSRDRECQ